MSMTRGDESVAVAAGACTLTAYAPGPDRTRVWARRMYLMVGRREAGGVWKTVLDIGKPMDTA